MVRPVPPSRVRWSFAAGGVVAAGLLTGLVGLSGAAPVVLFPAGTTWTVPAYDNSTMEAGGPALCSEHHDCGRAGALEIGMDLPYPSALVGILQVSEPVGVVWANAAGLAGDAGVLDVPPANCTTAAGAIYLVVLSSAGPQVDLENLDLAGAGSVVPAGVGTLLLTNLALTPVIVTVTSPITATSR